MTIELRKALCAKARIDRRRELHQQMKSFAAGLRELGLRAGHRVSQFSENSSRWLVADQGIMFNGAANAVRTCNTSLLHLPRLAQWQRRCCRHGIFSPAACAGALSCTGAAAAITKWKARPCCSVVPPLRVQSALSGNLRQLSLGLQCRLRCDGCRPRYRHLS